MNKKKLEYRLIYMAAQLMLEKEILEVGKLLQINFKRVILLLIQLVQFPQKVMKENGI